MLRLLVLSLPVVIVVSCIVVLLTMSDRLDADARTWLWLLPLMICSEAAVYGFVALIQSDEKKERDNRTLE